MRLSWLIVFLSVSLYAAPGGETLFQGNCLTCHDYKKTASAPAIKDVQARYKQAFATKEAFVSFMVAWISEPNAKTALMPQEIKKYGLMPLLGYDQESLEAIAGFLYEGNF